jgi:SAM-dependent methyltransferase
VQSCGSLDRFTNSCTMRSQYKTLGRLLIRSAATMMGRVLPLWMRKSLVASRVGRRSKASVEFALGLLSDLHRRDAGSFHRFLWSNHLAYAATYNVRARFGASNLNPSRRILLDSMASYLRSRRLDPGKDVLSVLDVGCSAGYLLRHIEVEVCPSAQVLHGLDIDRCAVGVGMAHLSSLQSKVRLFVGDMAAADRFIGDRTYDLILCCGVLMYDGENAAYDVVRTILSSANCLVGIISLANPTYSRTATRRSSIRRSDGAFIHDVESMIHRAGGKVVVSRRIETNISGSSPSHAILAEPACAVAMANPPSLRRSDRR